MKRFMLLVAVLFFMLPCIANADWSVTVTWTASTGPNLAYEQLLIDGVQQGANIVAGDPTTSNFTVANLTDQTVTIRSFNTQGEYTDATGPTLTQLGAPAPASGIIVNITLISP